MQRHDFYRHGVELRQHVPAAQRAPVCGLGGFGVLGTEQGGDQWRSNFQFLGGAAQHALDAAAGQVGQAVGLQKGKAVFDGMLQTQAGGKRRRGLGVDDAALRSGQRQSHGLLARAQDLH